MKLRKLNWSWGTCLLNSKYLALALAQAGVLVLYKCESQMDWE